MKSLSDIFRAIHVCQLPLSESLSMEDEISAQVGFALQLVSGSPASRWTRFGECVARIAAAARAAQSRFWFDHDGQVSGLATWALLRPQDEAIVAEKGPGAIDCGPTPGIPWAGGDSLWILDFVVAPHAPVHDILVELRSGLLDAHSHVAYFRARKNRRVAKRVDRRRFDSTRRAYRPPVELSIKEFAADHQRISVVESAVREAIEIGAMARVFARLPAYGTLPAQAMLVRLRTLALLGQYRLYRDGESDAPHSVVTWAWIDERHANEILRPASVRNLMNIHPTEWGHGANLCVCDAIVARDDATIIAADLAESLFPEESRIFAYPRPPIAPGVMTPGLALDRSRFSAWLRALPA